MRLVFAGTPQVALPTLDTLHAGEHEVVAAVTRPDAAAGRGRRVGASPVAERAEELGIPVLKPRHPADPEFVARLRGLRPDCCPVVGYGALLPEDLLALPAHGWVNLHFSLLPAWRGAAPVQRAVMAGDEVTGATVFAIVPELDAGPTYGLLTERIGTTDTAGDLLERLARHGAGLLADVLDHIDAGDIEARPQPEEGLSYAPKVSVEDARVDWGAPAFAVDRLVRGCTPAPGAWTTLEGMRLKLGPVRLADEGPALGPGEARVSKHAVHVGTSTVPVELGDVQPPGKKAMPAPAWARGARLGDGVSFA